MSSSPIKYLFCTRSDNKASVRILSDLRKALELRNVASAEFLLIKESGVLSFCESHDMQNYSGVIYLDLCGYGDSIVFTIKGRKSAFTRFINDKAQYVKFLPDDENVNMFRKFRVPVLSLAIVPRWDVQYLKALASFGDGLFGRPPEFDLILSQMEVSGKTQEENPEAMTQVYNYLLGSITAPEIKHKNFLRRLFS